MKRMKGVEHVKKNFLQESADVSAGKPARRPEAARREARGPDRRAGLVCVTPGAGSSVRHTHLPPRLTSAQSPCGPLVFFHVLHGLHSLHVSRQSTAHIIAG
jgi:hypothetical protein